MATRKRTKKSSLTRIARAPKARQRRAKIVLDKLTAEWVAGIRAAYRRYPALASALDEHLGPVTGPER